MDTREPTFQPQKHMRVIPRRQRQPDGSYKTVNNQYLDVKWRIVWFRQDHPEGNILTDLLTPPGESPAVVRATVAYQVEHPAVGWMETHVNGYGQCAKDDWGDYLEKAETRAIGRALQLAGYGTQFADDFEEPIADSPVNTGQPRSQQSRSGQQDTGEILTDKQLKAIHAISKRVGFTDDPQELVSYAAGIAGREIQSLDTLTKREASQVIQALNEFQGGDAPQSREDGRSDAAAPKQDDPPKSRAQAAQRKPREGEPLTPNQQKFINGLAAQLGMAAGELDEITQHRYGVDAHELSKSEASEIIGALQSLVNERGAEHAQ